jgi:hypothetical protein
MPELEIVLIIAIVLMLFLGVIVDSFKHKQKPLSQKNVFHIEWTPVGAPILKQRVELDKIEIKPNPTQPGYFSYAGMSRVTIKHKET